MNEPTKPCGCRDGSGQRTLRKRAGGVTVVTRVPAEDPDAVKARDRADIDRDFEATPGTDPVEYLGETDE